MANYSIVKFMANYRIVTDFGDMVNQRWVYSLAILQFAMENGHENTIRKFANFHGYVILPYFYFWNGSALPRLIGYEKSSLY